jgi:GNAT superfamily N-acetyltransferase
MPRSIPRAFLVPDRAAVAERLRRRLEARGPDHAYVIATLDGTPVGSATLDVDDPPHPGNMRRAVASGELRIAVLEGYRGQGVGRQLIDHLERWAAERGLERITLTVTETNDGAIRLYHELGYVDVGREMRKELRGGPGSR